MKLNLGQPTQCPHCENMLKTDYDRERGYCDLCAMTTCKHLSGFKLIPDPPEKVWGTWPYRRTVYRSEANCYGQDGVIDDD
ncbi:hypothetical protein N8569_00915 [bacterium]|nr:hypothetical protein [bacterium]